EGDAGASKHQWKPAERCRQITLPHRRECTNSDQRRGDEQDRHQAGAHRARSLERQATVAPTSETVTRAATASVARASCASKSLPTAALSNAPRRKAACTKSPRNAAYARSANRPAAPTAASCRQTPPTADSTA